MRQLAIITQSRTGSTALLWAIERLRNVKSYEELLHFGFYEGGWANYLHEKILQDKISLNPWKRQLILAEYIDKLGSDCESYINTIIYKVMYEQAVMEPGSFDIILNRADGIIFLKRKDYLAAAISSYWMTDIASKQNLPIHSNGAPYNGLMEISISEVDRRVKERLAIDNNIEYMLCNLDKPLFCIDHSELFNWKANSSFGYWLEKNFEIYINQIKPVISPRLDGNWQKYVLNSADIQKYYIENFGTI